MDGVPALNSEAKSLHSVFINDLALSVGTSLRQAVKILYKGSDLQSP